MPATLLVALLLAAPKTITLIHVNDTHSHLEAVGPKDANLDGTIGGLWKAASVIAAMRQTDPNTALVHSGDLFHGDLFFQAFGGVAEFEVLKSLGLDAMALGNHEFEWGPDPLYQAIGMSWPWPTEQPPLLCANLDFSKCEGFSCSLQDFVRPAFIKTIGGVQVGFFALTTPFDFIEQPQPLILLGKDDPLQLAAIAWTTAATLRAQGAQVVVLLSHLGLDLDRQLIIGSGAPIDVVIGAHDHAVQPAIEVPRPGGGKTVLAEAGDYYRYVGKVVLDIADDGSVTLAEGALIPIDASVPKLAAIDPFMQWFELQMKAMYGDVFRTGIATAGADFANQWNPAAKARDTAAGNLVTDIYRRHTGTDVAIEAMGLQDGTLVAGPIVGEDVFRLMPYGPPPLGYHLVTMRMTGAALLQGLELGVSMVAGTDLFLQVSGLRFDYDSCAPAGQRVVADSVHVRGHKLHFAAEYSVTANEFVLLALPGLGIPIIGAEVTPDLVYTVLRDEIARRGTIQPAVQNRIRDLGWNGCN